MKKTIIAIIILGLLLMVGWSKLSKNNTIFQKKEAPNQTQSNQNDKPQIISTNPDPLEDTIIPATQTLEITFNRPLENVGEFKLRIEPKTDVKVALSNDRKTAKIIPLKPYELGTGYTLFIGTETKFDGVGRWGQEKIFHFRTIRYRGV